MVKTVTSEEVTAEELGGADTHTQKSSVADGAFDNDLDALAEIRRLVGFLPAHNDAPLPRLDSGDDPARVIPALDSLVPENANTPYDMRELVTSLADAGDFYELQPHFAKNILTGFIRMNGFPVGVVANQPMVLAG